MRQRSPQTPPRKEERAAKRRGCGRRGASDRLAEDRAPQLEEASSGELFNRLAHFVVGRVIVEHDNTLRGQMWQPRLTIGDHRVIRMPPVDIQKVERSRPAGGNL